MSNRPSVPKRYGAIGFVKNVAELKKNYKSSYITVITGQNEDFPKYSYCTISSPDLEELQNIKNDENVILQKSSK